MALQIDGFCQSCRRYGRLGHLPEAPGSSSGLVCINGCRPRTTTLWLERVLRPKPLWFWFVLHVVALFVQLACVRAAPLAFQHTNGAGWWALCVTAKGP